MATRIQCPQCQARYRFDPSKTNKSVVRIKCPGCSHAFQVDLTTLQDEPDEHPEPEVVQQPTVKKILIVDDSGFFREVILDILKPLGIEIITAADGDEGLAVIHSEKPSLVMLDLNLPRKNGYELIREVRANADLKNVRLLAMSGVFRKNEDISEVYRGGADDFISKSFKPEQLLERVKKLLE